MNRRIFIKVITFRKAYKSAKGDACFSLYPKFIQNNLLQADLTLSIMHFDIVFSVQGKLREDEG